MSRSLKLDSGFAQSGGGPPTRDRADYALQILDGGELLNYSF